MVNYFKKPWLLLPAKWAHSWSPFLLNALHKKKPHKNLKHHWKELSWEGLHFRNPVGTAGGLDKNGVNIEAWWNLGAGFIEVGTVTPLLQKQNPGIVVDRDIRLKALWNCLGFPNNGSLQLKNRLEGFPKNKRTTPIFVNIGKNRDTPNEDAASDYIYLIEALRHVADAFVLNISSPNTKGLRDLFKKENLSQFLKPIFDTAKKLNSPPLLLKLSPDLELSDLENIISATENLDLKGWILTNTTQERTNEMHFDKYKGGVSGEPLKQKSEKMLEDFVKLLGKNRFKYLIISTGGISSKEDILKRQDLGADLTQVYTCLIFQGPKFFKRIIM